MWCGVVLCGVVWCGVVWCGVVWCGVAGGGVVDRKCKELNCCHGIRYSMLSSD